MRRLFSPVFRARRARPRPSVVPVLGLCVLAAMAVSAGLGAQDTPMTPSAAAPAPDAKLLERARALHKQVPLTDGHNDLPWAMRNGAWYDFSKIDIKLPQPTLHTDIARLRQGGLGAQFW